LWIAEKHRAATHDSIATQRILSVPTNRRVIEAVERVLEGTPRDLMFAAHFHGG